MALGKNGAKVIVSTGRGSIVGPGGKPAPAPSNLPLPGFTTNIKPMDDKVEDIRPCTRCDHCGNHNKYGLSMRCAVNPRFGYPEKLQPVAPEESKKVMDVEHHRVPVGDHVVVCGGGITGMECTLVLAMEGKRVTVIDMQPVE